MNVYPIIYTRTNYCDYYPKFHVIPDFIDSKEIIQFILSATSDLDPTIYNPKEILISNGKYCIYGYICFTKDFLDEKFKSYTRDDKGRAIYGFFGFVTIIEDNNTIPILKIENCVELFIKHIIPVWNSTIPESKIAMKMQIDETTPFYNVPNPDYICNNTFYYLDKKDIFNSLISLAFKNQNTVSYCSSIQDYEKLKDCIFNHVVTTSNLISRLKNTYCFADQSDENENYIKESLSPQDELRLMIQGKISHNFDEKNGFAINENGTGNTNKPPIKVKVRCISKRKRIADFISSKSQHLKSHKKRKDIKDE